jgi:sensor histidine kinase YesM
MQEHETAIARIKQLESQLNPHFLFNTMENVRFMIRLDPKVADKMIVGLSNLLRYSIKDDNTKSVTLGVEIEHTRDYLTLLHYRFGERFYYEINVQDQLENALIPRLLFQPIVENSVVHGLEGKEEIHVAISVSRADQVLLIDINDDGAGMSDETLDQLRSSLQSNEYETYHIGICNVHQRIRLLYGDSYGLHINSELGKGTSIQIRLPYIL